MEQVELEILNFIDNLATGQAVWRRPGYELDEQIRITSAPLTNREWIRALRMLYKDGYLIKSTFRPAKGAIYPAGKSKVVYCLSAKAKAVLKASGDKL